jgi:hypothetical protein
MSLITARTETASYHLAALPEPAAATSVGATADLARGCPILPHRGAVEVGELTIRGNLFGEWLADDLST